MGEVTECRETAETALQIAGWMAGVPEQLDKAAILLRAIPIMAAK